MMISLQMEKPPWMFSRFPPWISWYLAISLLSWRSMALKTHPFRGGTHYRGRETDAYFQITILRIIHYATEQHILLTAKVLLRRQEWVFRHVLFDLLNKKREKETWKKYKDLRKERWQTGVEIRGMNCSRTTLLTLWNLSRCTEVTGNY